MPEFAQVSGGWREPSQGNGALRKAALAAFALAVPALVWSWRTGRIP
jgi:hypothetical protein